MPKLDADTLKNIDALVAFYSESDRNAELLEIVFRFMSVAKIKGSAEVFGDRLRDARAAREERVVVE